MYTKESLEKRTVRQLRVTARNLGLSVSYRARKGELIDMIIDYTERFAPKVRTKNEEKDVSVRVKRLKELNNEQ